ncbi:CHAT domain-containing protein [Streptomyces asoensis]|uniref:CHAT domain-containing protein n=1 Tax=Streptomyces asoensis TaxID=249586 RepID=UPI0033FA917A
MSTERTSARAGRLAPEMCDEEAAERWLAGRGGAEDRAAEETISFQDVLLAMTGISTSYALSLLPRSLKGTLMLSRRRTTGRTIGLWHADSLHIHWRAALLPALLDHLVIGTAVAQLLRFVGLAQPAVVVMGLACGPLAALWRLVRLSRPAVLVAAAPPLTAAWLDPAWWWLDAICYAIALTLIQAVHLHRSVIGKTWTAVGPVFGFIPWRARLSMVLRGRWSLFATALDLASNGRQACAPFVERLSAEGLPAECVPLLTMARAHVLFLRDEQSEALLAAREAVKEARNVGGTVLGWCLGDLSRFRLRNGEESAAAEARTEALGLLSPRRCRRHARRLWLEHVRGHLESAPLVELLGEIHAMRLIAVRTLDQRLLRETELWLAQLMVRVGNAEGARETLRATAHHSDARADIHETNEESVRRRLQAAFVLVETESTRDDARRDALAALAMLRAADRPLAAVAARLALARAQELDGDEEAALTQAVHALIAVHEARYRVGEARGRRLWERMQLTAYATALRLASRGSGADTATLVAEMLETARGEVLPRRLDASELDRHLALLDAVTATELEPTVGAGPSPGSRTDNLSALYELGLSPVRRPPAIAIGGRRLLPGTTGTDGVLDLDRALFALAGRCWYWSAITVKDRYYWAVRSPDGRWSYGDRSIGPASEAARADGELRAALPVRRPGESNAALRERVSAGPLSDPGSSAEDTSRGRPEAAAVPELALLSRVSRAFLPPPLATGLAESGPEPATLVVSLPAGLSHIPVAALPLIPGRDHRVVDSARVLHVPGWATVDHCLTRRPRTRGGPVPMRLAVLRPDAEDGVTGVFHPPPEARHIQKGPCTKSELSSVFRALHQDHGLLYLVGHVDPEPDNPYFGGLRVRPEAEGGAARVAMADMVPARTEAGPAEGPAFPVPSHVITVGCESLGLQPPPGTEAVRTGVTEWLGFGSALLLSGAEHVICTLYTVPETKQLNRAARCMARRVAQGVAPVDALREMQLTHLRRWRRTRRGHPFAWQSFAYSGVGGRS